MKKLYNMINFEFVIIYKFIIGISVLLIIGQNLLLYLAGRDFHTGRYIPFEKLIDQSGMPVLFYTCFGLVLACFVYSVSINYIGSKSIYTLMALPQPRGRVFISKISAAAISFLMFAAAQFISIFIGYLLFASPISYWENGRMMFERPVNGLFLAFVRSEFLRILFPLSLKSFLSTVFISVSVVLAVFFVIFCVQSRKYVHIGVALINVILGIYVITLRINAINGGQKQNLYIYSLVFAVLSFYYIRQSIRWIDRSSILG